MLNLVFLFWILGSFAIVCAKCLHNRKWIITPVIKSLLVYGKTNKNDCHPFFTFLMLPKRWFVHFYITGVILNSYAAYMTWSVYTQKQTPPKYILFLLDHLSHFALRKQNIPSIDQNCAILLVSLMFIQNLRRLYECVFISVYSKGTMHLAHYAAGIAMYSTFHIAVLVEAPRLDQVKSESSSPFNIFWWQTFGLTLFVWASWQQYQIHCHLGSLRTNSQGKVVSYQHYLPKGGWFSLVSSPHYLMEMLIYTSFLLITGFHHWTLWSIVIFVFTNQLTAGHMSHKWYQTEFTSYPKDTKAVIPFIF